MDNCNCCRGLCDHHSWMEGNKNMSIWFKWDCNFDYLCCNRGCCRTQISNHQDHDISRLTFYQLLVCWWGRPNKDGQRLDKTTVFFSWPHCQTLLQRMSSLELGEVVAGLFDGKSWYQWISFGENVQEPPYLMGTSLQICGFRQIFPSKTDPLMWGCP